MAEAGLKEDSTTNRAAWWNNIHSYAGEPRSMTEQAMDEAEEDSVAGFLTCG